MLRCYPVALVILIIKFKLHACICERNASPVRALFFLPLFHPPKAVQATGTGEELRELEESGS